MAGAKETAQESNKAGAPLGLHPSLDLAFHGVRYQSEDVARSVNFYTHILGFKLEHQQLPDFANVSLGPLKVLISGRGASGSRPLPGGQRQQPGGWNRIVLRAPDLAASKSKSKTLTATPSNCSSLRAPRTKKRSGGHRCSGSQALDLLRRGHSQSGRAHCARSVSVQLSKLARLALMLNESDRLDASSQQSEPMQLRFRFMEDRVSGALVGIKNNKRCHHDKVPPDEGRSIGPGIVLGGGSR